MLEILSIIPTVAATDIPYNEVAIWYIWTKGIISLLGLFALFLVLVTEKIDKALISIIIAGLLILFQVFTHWDPNGPSSQDIAGIFIYKNLDIFAFIIGMMILSWIAKWSWVFDYIAILLAKKVKWNPKKLFFTFAYMAFFMTIFISNIPTIIILTPIVILITKKIDIPSLPYIIWIITFANLGWAVTPISDPTTYYQATTLWFSFLQVLSNTWFIMFILTIVSSIYLYLVFRKDFQIEPELSDIMSINPRHYIKNREEVVVSIWILFSVVLVILLKEYIYILTWVKFDNWTITLFGAFYAILLLWKNISNILKMNVDYSTLFFFAWLFIVIWALEYNGLIIMLANWLVSITWWSESYLLFMITIWSAMLSVVIDNVPYNIAMVSTLNQFLESWAVSWAAWMALAWWLNACTSIWWAWSPIWAACNVIALWQAEKTWIIIKFFKYLMIWVPLVLINSLIAFTILYFRYLF